MAYKPKILALTEGGTNASLTASNGGMLYSTASAVAVLSGTVTAGQILRSGASTTPSWSTATYPATAGTSGKVLISDGTNIVSSTPTFPNASATSGKFIRSDGTNWIASTPTLPTTGGTASTLLRSDGTNWVNTSAFKVDSGDIMTNTSQPILVAQVNSTLTDVTGDGTTYTVVFDTIASQQGSNFNTGTGVFTVPVAGYYLVSVSLLLNGLTASFTSADLRIAGSAGTYAKKLYNPGVGFIAASTQYAVETTKVISIAAAATIFIQIIVSGSTKTIDIVQESFGPYSYLSIAKLA